MTRRPYIPVKIGFEETSLRIPIDAILPLREVSENVRKSMKYGQIAAAIAEVGIIEPPAVARDATDRNKFHLLDGHLRLDILRARGEAEVVCLIAIDDEAFTYNKRISRIATIQEHKMILNAIKKGVSEERLARALNVDIHNIRLKRNLLVGICPEVADLLRDRHVPINTFSELRRLKEVRQMEVAMAMIAMNRYSVGYVKTMVASTPDDHFVPGRKPRTKLGMSNDQIEMMARESDMVGRQFNLITKDYGVDNLDLAVAVGYVSNLLDNAAVVRHLAQHHSDLLAEFQKVADWQKAA
ncbi:plasmid partitioning protein RepB C-terminal domain-containing protein [Sphingobium sp. CR2-8]|uniref:plasmid partitioning protein RepB C-terminal domain-containing protein n=1 Tax=Sphingobium sp. CR2-8 TaxID=1306534 RepID=UPI002DBAB8E8|nr:plasmid partitioning protein RepB C-terminal domain-containing protein [Sphingobium sp. CR2-8]MEC3910054.1 plasmid partitioning protein RepB C-terminal domain-containing protein [Sphingobium sp. CR2-8]